MKEKLISLYCDLKCSWNSLLRFISTKATGINKVASTMAKAVGKGDCGCNKRQDTLNRVFPYSK